MSTATCCTTTVLPTHSPLHVRWAIALQEGWVRAWRRWREHADMLAQQRALNALSDSTLRDIGLAERRIDVPTLDATDWERGRW